MIQWLSELEPVQWIALAWGIGLCITAGYQWGRRSYAKQLSEALPALQEAGVTGAEAVRELRWKMRIWAPDKWGG